jgi:prepilin-type N-terminal cleavage/methylation domain-containing protein
MHDSGLMPTLRPRRRPRSRRISARPGRGFTILELVVVLAVIAALTALLAPTAFESIGSSRLASTEDQVRRIFVSIVGDPERGNFGYLGDMGRLPTALSELVTQGTQTAWHTSDSGVAHKGAVGTGWRGPYLTGASDTGDLFRDAWGQTLTYSAGQITSGGPDGQIATTGDNIVYPVQTPVQTTGTIIVTVIVNEIPQPGGLTVRVYSTSNGEQGAAVTQTTTTPSAGLPFRFTVPHGTSVIETSHTSGTTTVTRTTTVDVAAGTQLSRTIIMRTSASVSM